MKNHDNMDLLLSLIAKADSVVRRFDRLLSNTRGISFTEYRMLNELQQRFGGSATRVDLATAVSLTPSAITRALKPLEKLGYVETVKSSRDARRSLATLTAGGAELLSDSQSVLYDEVAAQSIKKADRQALLKLLTVIEF